MISLKPRQYLSAGLTLVLGAALSFAAFVLFLQHGLDMAKVEFIEAAEERLVAVEKRINSELIVMRSIVGYFQGTPNVTRDQFFSFINTVMTDKNSFQALEWVPRVPLNERVAYEQMARQDGLLTFASKKNPLKEK